MDKIKINLIPPEIKQKAKERAKRSLVNRISIGLLVLLIMFTSGVLGVVIYENAKIQNLNGQINREKIKIGGLKDKETVAYFLKNRIDTINQYTNTRFKQGETFELITSLFPGAVNLTSLKIDKTANVSLQGETQDTSALNNFFDSLTDPQTNEGKIALVSIESLNQSQGKIRFDLKVTLSEKLE